MDAPVRARCFRAAWLCDRVRSCIRPRDAACHDRWPVWRCADLAQINHASCKLFGIYCFSRPGSNNHLTLPFDDLLHVWMPPFAQDVFERLDRVIGCGHVSGLQMRPVTTAGRYGDARTWRKSIEASCELGGIYCVSRPGSDRSFDLTVRRPPHTPDVPLARVV